MSTNSKIPFTLAELRQDADMKQLQAELQKDMNYTSDQILNSLKSEAIDQIKLMYALRETCKSRTFEVESYFHCDRPEEFIIKQLLNKKLQDWVAQFDFITDVTSETSQTQRRINYTVKFTLSDEFFQ